MRNIKNRLPFQAACFSSNPGEPMLSFFHPLCKAGWCPADRLCRPLAFKNGGLTYRSLDPGSIF